MRRFFATKNISALVVIGALLVSSHVHAQDVSGEIINVNPSQNIAFIDLGKDSVSAGDVFAIESSAGPIFLEVVEAASAVSKLSLCSKENYKSTPLDFQAVSIGAAAKKVLSSKLPSAAALVKEGSAVQQQMPTGIPNIDPQVLVKPNIANETIQSLDTRLDKMVESNVKLFNTLTELLNEKKQWQAGEDQIRAELQAAQTQIQTLNLANIDLKKQLADANFQTANAVAENAKNKKMFEDAQSKLQSLKTRLDSLNKIIQDRLRQ